MSVRLRQFTRQDIEFGLTQTSREGWDNTAGYFETCLTHDPDGAFIAELDGRRAGMVTTTRYARTAWIGNLIVEPDCRRGGVGAVLMNRAIEHISSSGIGTIRLEADPPGVKLYRRLGFLDEFESLRFRCDESRGPRHSSARPVTSGDLPSVAAFDAEHFGDDRGRLLSLFFESAKAAYLIGDRSHLRGYAMVLPSAGGLRIGPWVAVDSDAAEQLFASIMAASVGDQVVVGVPKPNREAPAFLEAQGFYPTSSSTRMIRGEIIAAGHPSNIHAIGSGAMG